MRVHVKPRHRLGPLIYSAMVGEHAFDIRQSRYRLRSPCDEWHFYWPTIGEIVLQIPVFRPRVKPVWNVMLDGELICQGELRQSFIPSRHDGIYWHFQEDILFERSWPRMKMHHALRDQTKKVLACWNPACYGVIGVIRPALPRDTMVAVFGIMAISLLASY